MFFFDGNFTFFCGVLCFQIVFSELQICIASAQFTIASPSGISSVLKTSPAAGRLQLATWLATISLNPKFESELPSGTRRTNLGTHGPDQFIGSALLPHHLPSPPIGTNAHIHMHTSRPRTCTRMGTLIYTHIHQMHAETQNPACK